MAIAAVEVDAPPGSEPLHWKLLSSIACAEAAAVQRQLGWYARGWGIEVFHRTLKSGCQSEARRLGSLERLQRALSLDMIVAWRLMALRDAARQQPEADAGQWLEPEEGAVLRLWAAHQAGKRSRSRSSQSSNNTSSQRRVSSAEALRWIARLGGYLNRIHDPPPGAQVIWRGLRHLHDMTATWKLAQLVGKS